MRVHKLKYSSNLINGPVYAIADPALNIIRFTPS
jgi:hypothetical protein